VRELRESADWKEPRQPKIQIPLGVGKDVYGKNDYCRPRTDAALLVAGTTGAGKRVCINALVSSISSVSRRKTSIHYDRSGKSSSWQVTEIFRTFVSGHYRSKKKCSWSWRG